MTESPGTAPTPGVIPGNPRPPAFPGHSRPAAHVEGLGARAASIPTPSRGDPALDPVRPLGATVIQIMNNYNDIKRVNDRYSASPAHHDTCKNPLLNAETSFPWRFGLG